MLESRPCTHPRHVQLLHLCVLLMLPAFPACSPSESHPASGKMVYIDSVTTLPVIQQSSYDYPAVNLQTGEKTLRPAAYCDRCRKWQAIPSLDTIQRRGQLLKCSQCQAQLRFDGPFPSE